MTTFRVTSYHKSPTLGPKKEHPQHIIYNKEYNIVNNLTKDTKPSLSVDRRNSGLGSKSLTPSGSEGVNNGRQKVNRLRPQVVDNYIKSIMNLGAHSVMSNRKNSQAVIDQSQNSVQIIEQIYRMNIDNRIFNNLRQQLNEMIDDEQGVCSVEIFKQLFFTYFKGEPSANQVYEMLLPLVTTYFDEGTKTLSEKQNAAESLTRVVLIVKLTQFIDLFNYYPVRVHKVRYKNDSNELTYVMNSNTHGTQNERGERVYEQVKCLSPEEAHLIKLLSVVSEKINERFTDFHHCFRFLDTNHSQSISINEFAQALEHMRVKISFEDTKRLFNYLDKDGKGELGYDEFSMLIEEKWRGLDPTRMARPAHKFAKKQNPIYSQSQQDS